MKWIIRYDFSNLKDKLSWQRPKNGSFIADTKYITRIIHRYL